MRTERREVQLRRLHTLAMEVGGRDETAMTARLQLTRNRQVGMQFPGDPHTANVMRLAMIE